MPDVSEVAGGPDTPHRDTMSTQRSIWHTDRHVVLSDGRRLTCCDPLVERFLGAKYRMLLWGRPFRDVVEGLIERSFAGHHYYVIARTRYFDDLLEQRLADGAEQLVILGAD